MTLPPLLGGGNSTLVLASTASLSSSEPYISASNLKPIKTISDSTSNLFSNRIFPEHERENGYFPNVSSGLHSGALNPETGLRPVLGSNRSIEAYYRHLERFQVPRTTSWTNLQALLSSYEDRESTESPVMPLSCKNPPRILKPLRLVDHNRDRSMWLFGNPWALTEPKVLQERPLLKGEEKLSSLESIELLQAPEAIRPYSNFKERNIHHSQTNKWDLNEKRPSTTFHNHFTHYSVVPPFTPSKEDKRRRKGSPTKSPREDKVEDKKLFMDAIDTLENVFINYLNDSSSKANSPVETYLKGDSAPMSRRSEADEFQGSTPFTLEKTEQERQASAPVKLADDDLCSKQSSTINSLKRNSVKKEITERMDTEPKKNINSEQFKPGKNDKLDSEKPKHGTKSVVSPRKAENRIFENKNPIKSKKNNEVSPNNKKRFSRRDQSKNNSRESRKPSRNMSVDAHKTRKEVSMNNTTKNNKKNNSGKNGRRTSSLPAKTTKQYINKWKSEHETKTSAKKKPSNSVLSPKKPNKDSNQRHHVTKKNVPTVKRKSSNEKKEPVSVLSTKEHLQTPVHDNTSMGKPGKLIETERHSSISDEEPIQEVDSSKNETRNESPVPSNIEKYIKNDSPDRPDEDTYSQGSERNNIRNGSTTSSIVEKFNKDDDVPQERSDEDTSRRSSVGNASRAVSGKEDGDFSEKVSSNKDEPHRKEDEHTEEEDSFFLKRSSIDSSNGIESEKHDETPIIENLEEKSIPEPIPIDDSENINAIDKDTTPKIPSDAELSFANNTSTAIISDALSDLSSKFSKHFESKALVLAKPASFDEDAFEKSVQQLCNEILSRNVLNSLDRETTLPESLLPMAFNERPRIQFTSEIPNFEESSPTKSSTASIRTFHSPRKYFADSSKRKRNGIQKLRSRFLE